MARIRSEHPPSERKTVIRQVELVLICSVWLLWWHLFKIKYLPVLSGPVAWPPYAIPCIWRCKVQVEYWTAEACVGVRTWPAPWKRTHQVYPSKLPHAALPDRRAWDHVPQTEATGSLHGEKEGTVSSLKQHFVHTMGQQEVAVSLISVFLSNSVLTKQGWSTSWMTIDENFMLGYSITLEKGQKLATTAVESFDLGKNNVGNLSHWRQEPDIRGC